MIVTIEARADMLRAALMFVSREAPRYYLGGVHINPAGLAVSTDGHRLFVGALASSDERAALPAFDGWTIPGEALKRALQGFKPPRGAVDPRITVTPERVGDVAYKPIDGGYPDWRRVIPEVAKIDGAAAQYQGQYLADFDKAAALLRGDRRGQCRVYQDGQNPALVSFGERSNYTPGRPARVPVEAFGVLMPLRDIEGAKPPFTALSILETPHND
jgi:hypothetical protein